MDEKLNRGKLIKKYIGKGLSDLGFLYKKSAGNLWIFEREQDQFTWYVYIDVYRFDPWQITFFLETNAPGAMRVCAHQLKGLSTNGEMCGYWKYHDEDSMKKVLGEMLEVIRSQGIETLKELSVPMKISADNEMYHELYLHHEELAESFEKRTGIAATGYDEDNLRRWFDYIDNRIEELNKEQNDAATKRELLEMAGFLGENIVKYKGGRWEHYIHPNKKETFCIIYKQVISERKKTDDLINVLSLLVGKYLGNSREWLEESFYEVISTTEYSGD